MTQIEVANMIASIGYPWHYDHFQKTPSMPYIVYYYPNDDDVYADDSNFVNRRRLYVELYTRAKDMTAETAVESALKRAGLTWYKQTDFLSDELIFQTTYEMEVIINGE